jgi:hypothetical protein
MVFCMCVRARRYGCFRAASVRMCARARDIALCASAIQRERAYVCMYVCVHIGPHARDNCSSFKIRLSFLAWGLGMLFHAFVTHARPEISRMRTARVQHMQNRASSTSRLHIAQGRAGPLNTICTHGILASDRGRAGVVLP